MHDNLFLELCSKEKLHMAWQRVNEKHSSGGIDKKTVDDYGSNVKQNLAELSNSLKSGKYAQQPYLEKFIPKNENEKRRIGLLTVNDKIVQTAATMILTPVFETMNLDVSYAYRSHKGPMKAIRKVQHLISNEKYLWLASCDVDNFFDTIPHQVLFKRLAAFLKSPGMIEIIRMFIKMGSVNSDFQWKDSIQGIPQGGVVSPMLANFYMYPLDKLMVESAFGYVRYADDFIILAKTKQAAHDALEKAVSTLTKTLKLQLNEGAKVVPISDSFEFLGITFADDGLTISDRKFNRLVNKMLDASRVGEGIITEKLLEVNRHILDYYSQLLPQSVLSKLDDELMTIVNNKIALRYLETGNKKHIVQELDKIRFFAKQHALHRFEYIESTVVSFPEQFKKNPIFPKGTLGLNTEVAIEIRKDEYHKLEASDFDLILDQSVISINRFDNKFVIHLQNLPERKVLVKNVKNIIIQNQAVLISGKVIATCVEKNITLNFLKESGMPYAILHKPEWNGPDTGLAQLQAYTDAKGPTIIRQIVWGKITNQINLLKYFGRYYGHRIPTFEKALNKSLKIMTFHADDIRSLPYQTIDDLREKVKEIDDQITEMYWDTLGVLINIREPFAYTKEKNPTDLVNRMLVYGNGILDGRITSALIKAGLNPSLGYIHKPMDASASLVLDLNMVFRQHAVDKMVVNAIIKHNNLACHDGKLADKTRKVLTTDLIERLNKVEAIGSSELRFYEIIDEQVNNLLLFLTGGSEAFVPYIRKW